VWNRGDAYEVLTNRLEQFRSFGYDELLPLVNGPAVSETVRVNGVDVVIDVTVVWRDERRRTLCIHGTASGPSTYLMERLDEHVIVLPGDRGVR
jgi:hypothetical protein